jgi:hypothetical protein
MDTERRVCSKRNNADTERGHAWLDASARPTRTQYRMESKISLPSNQTDRKRYNWTNK